VKKTLLFTSILLAISGCKDDVSLDLTTPTPEPEVPTTQYQVNLTSLNKEVTGDVYCNGKKMEGAYPLTVDAGDPVSCLLGGIVLGEFEIPEDPKEEIEKTLVKEHSLKIVMGHADNAYQVLNSINACKNDRQICLVEKDSWEIATIFNETSLSNQEEVDLFLETKKDESTDEVGKAPSSHDDPTLSPVPSGGSSDLGSNFVSASAEANLSYKPSGNNKTLTKSVLIDIDGNTISGIQYYSANSTGITGSDGVIEFLWGDSISLGIDTFEIGTLKGNQLSYKITDVTENEIKKENIQSLLERYSDLSGKSLIVKDNVDDVFANYPNVINELINLNLPNGGTLEGAMDASGNPLKIPSEFDEQFKQGLALIIDTEINGESLQGRNGSNRSLVYSVDDNSTLVTDTLNKLYSDVNVFHVFHNAQGGYANSGQAIGTRTLNMSNRAFPLTMDRGDINHQLALGEKEVWSREGNPHIAEHPDAAEGVDMYAMIPTVSSDNTTYKLPFVAAGEIGQGKVVFMGNSMYPSILSCPDTYWDVWGRVNSESKNCTSNTSSDNSHSDKGSMKRFFANLFSWMTESSSTYSVASKINVVTNIDQALYHNHNSYGNLYDFFIDDQFNINLEKLQKDGFNNLSAADTPLLILQAYEPKREMNNNFADISKPNLSIDDVTNIINYINQGGSVLFMDALPQVNPEPIGRLADAAGLAVGGQNVVSTFTNACGNSSNKWCDDNKNPSVQLRHGRNIVVLTRFDDVKAGEQPFTVKPDGTVEWVKPEDMTDFYVPKFEHIDESGNKTMKSALIRYDTESEKQAAITELQAAFPSTPLCTNDKYEFEFNCIETRKGTGFTEQSYGRRDFERIHVDVKGMVKAANLGDNVEKLLNHEVYYTTEGKQGTRLSLTELNQTYDNLSVWFTNDNEYYFDKTASTDELGFKKVVEMLNCYTNGQHGASAGGTPVSCSAELEDKLVKNGMLIGSTGNYELNPNYPLNYQIRPLTRIMLGRSYFDYDIKVDTTQYPTKPDVAENQNVTIEIDTDGKAVTFSAGNMQSTGAWANQLQPFTIDGDVSATITVMLADDLTGRPQHEVSLKRPPRLQKSFTYVAGSKDQYEVPYGGLIYVKPLGSTESGKANFTFTNVSRAALWQDGDWVTSPQDAAAKVGEIDTGHFVYTAPSKNFIDADIDQFITDMNRFANAASDFYGRDGITEESAHRRFTYETTVDVKGLEGFAHRYFEDVQISIGAAHSGYPVMSSGMDKNSSVIKLDSVESGWLLWHETGHNLASAPFLAKGSTEVTNNILALYMQELEGRKNPKMNRIETAIKNAPTWLSDNNGHAWAHGDAGIRLVMFGQLKVWAESHFDISDWYGSDVPDIYNADQGWNMFKLMHRKARGDVIGDLNGKNYCSTADTQLSGANLMMTCASYVSGYDLSSFFRAWNVGETSMTPPEGETEYTPELTQQAFDMVAGIDGLKQPKVNPLTINYVN